MKLLSERIKLILKENPELDQVSLGKLAGASKSVVNQWLSGAIRSMNVKYAVKLERELGYNSVWLQMGSGPVRDTDSKQLANTVISRLRSPSSHKHGIGKDGESANTESSDHVFIRRHALDTKTSDRGGEPPDTFEYHKHELEEKGLDVESLAVVIAPDNSMGKVIPEGAELLVDTSDTSIIDNKIYVLASKNRIRVRRLFIRHDGMIVLRSENSDYPEEVAPQEEMVVVGRVVKMTVDL